MTDATGLMAQARIALNRAERQGHAGTAGLSAGIAALESGERAAAASLVHATAPPPVNPNLGLLR